MLSPNEMNLNSNVTSQTLPEEDSPPLCDEATGDSEVSLRSDIESQVLDMTATSAATTPGNFQKREMLDGKVHSRENKNKSKRVQRKKSIPPRDVEKVTGQNLNAMSAEKETQTLNTGTATSPFKLNAQTFVNKEQGLQEMLVPRSFSNGEKNTQTQQVNGVDRATSPGLDGIYEWRRTSEAQKCHEAAVSAKTSLVDLDGSHECEQSTPYGEEAQTHQDKTAESSTRASNTHFTDGTLQGKVFNHYLTGNDQRSEKACSYTAEQAIARILRETFRSGYGPTIEHHGMCDNHIHSVAKQQDFLKKLYHTFVELQDTGR